LGYRRHQRDFGRTPAWSWKKAKEAAVTLSKELGPSSIRQRGDLREDQAIPSADSYELVIILFDRRLIDETVLEAGLWELQRRGLDLLATHDLAAFPSPIHRHLATELPPLDPAQTTAAVLLDVRPEVGGPPFGGFANRRVGRGMLAVRQLAKARAGPAAAAGVNVLDGRAARQFADALDAAKASDLNARIADEMARFRAGGCLEHVKAGDRSMVQLIDWHGRPAIRKIYRRSSVHLMRQAIDVLENLAPDTPQLAKLLEKGPFHIVVEYVAGGSTLAQNTRRFPRPLSLTRVRKLARFIHHCIARGYDPVDLSPGTNLIWIGDEFRVIDCEFWTHCDPRSRPEDSATLRGWSADNARGPMTSWVRDPYRRRWIAFTCLDVHSFLYDPPWLQRLKRPLVYARLVPGALGYAFWYRTRSALKRHASAKA
jgi:hypothetical protein